MNQTNTTKDNCEAAVFPKAPHLGPTSIPLLLIVIGGITENVVLLTVFAIHRELWTPFNVYVVNLLVANFCLIVTQFPLDIYSSFYDGEWYLGDGACSCYLFVNWYLPYVIFNSHQLIAVNRIWAVTRPLSYQKGHSVRTSACLCFGVWLVLGVSTAPGLIIDWLYYRCPSDGPIGCYLTTAHQREWSIAVLVLYQMWPQVVMVAALAVVYFARRSRDRQKDAWKSSSVVPSGGSAVSEAIVPKNVDSQLKTDGSAPEPKQSIRKVSQKSSGTNLLIFLTVSVTVCWTPNTIWSTMAYIDESYLDDLTPYEVSELLLALQTVVDPILFVLALPVLRKNLRTMFGMRAANLT